MSKTKIMAVPKRQNSGPKFAEIQPDFYSCFASLYKIGFSDLIRLRIL
jgi:hypothetical protein